MEIQNKNGLQAGVGIPLLPNPTDGGGWSKTPLSVSAAGDWLRALLKLEMINQKTVRALQPIAARQHFCRWLLAMVLTGAHVGC